MYKFESIRIRGYRRLLDTGELQMRPLTVIIGANGSGKTSFLEAWSLLAASSSNQFSAKISELGGLGDLITRDRASNIAFDVAMSVPNHPRLEYHVQIQPQGQFYEIGLEILKQQNRPAPQAPFKHIESEGLDVRYYDVDNHKLVRPNWDHNPLETSLAQVPKMFQEPETLRRRLSSSTFYGPLNIGPKAPVRLPQ